jgi:3-isopropylmalate/(R)-2-methylmalate dehydratase small subunit
MGLPIFELEDTNSFKEGDLLQINMESGEIKDVNSGATHTFTPIPEFMQNLLANGGLMNYAKAQVLQK